MDNSIITLGLGGPALVTMGYGGTGVVGPGPPDIPPVAGPLYVVPSRIDPDAATRVDFYSVGTAWNVTPPVFIASGLPTDAFGWGVEPTIVDGPTAAHIMVEAGDVTGDVFWTETTSGVVAVMQVDDGASTAFLALKPNKLFRPGPTRWYRRGGN